MKKFNTYIITAVILASTCWSASAAVIYTETWDANDSGWTIGTAAAGGGAQEPGSSALWNDGTDGGQAGDGYLRINTGTPALGFSEHFVTAGAAGSGANFTGDFSSAGKSVQGVSFNFYNPSATVVPQLTVYLVAGGHTWYHTALAITPNGWGNYGVNFSDHALNAGTGDWFTLAGTEDLADWQSDIQSVTALGLSVFDDGSFNNQWIGLDDFQIMDDPYFVTVPEPQTYAMLGFAFLSLGVTFRRKLENSLASLKAMFA